MVLANHDLPAGIVFRLLPQKGRLSTSPSFLPDTPRPSSAPVIDLRVANMIISEPLRVNGIIAAMIRAQASVFAIVGSFSDVLPFIRRHRGRRFMIWPTSLTDEMARKERV
ncbi:hypothetical protein DMB90_10555 [Raoultella planticola]|uniref:Uncharacterized protein n=1 Tax=Raoultella planticola TaxID=575 RepID=A0A5P6A9P5_RAOPL|nr:hypothetical protein DMB90_10555 [Raoultella planticola]